MTHSRIALSLLAGLTASCMVGDADSPAPDHEPTRAPAAQPINLPTTIDVPIGDWWLAPEQTFQSTYLGGPHGPASAYCGGNYWYTIQGSFGAVTASSLELDTITNCYYPEGNAQVVPQVLYVDNSRTAVTRTEENLLGRSFGACHTYSIYATYAVSAGPAVVDFRSAAGIPANGDITGGDFQCLQQAEIVFEVAGTGGNNRDGARHCTDGPCVDGLQCVNGSIEVCDAGNSCPYACAAYGYAEGQCNQGYQCENGCIVQDGCQPASGCQYACAEYGYVEGQCYQGYQCTNGCVISDGCQ